MDNNPLRIALIGASGRLGQAIAGLALQSPGFSLSAAIGRNSDRSSLSCDLLIDASSADALSENLQTALSLQKPIVVGTTGIADFTPLEKAALQIPVFYAPNFSLGMALMNKLAREIAAKFHSDAHIDLIETHHTRKKDAPSGAALLLSKTVQEASRSPVKIHSLRSGSVVGEHTLLFNTAEERLSITHEAHSREAFARGALAAARFLVRQPPGLYGMDNLLA